MSTKCQPSLFILSSPGKHIRGCRGKHGQRQTTPVPRQSPIFRAGSSLDPRKKSGGDSDEARKMQVFNQIGPGSGPLCQNPQHRGVFLQVALPDCVHFSEYCLLALLWRNSGVKEKYYRPADKLACAVIIYLALAKSATGITMLNRFKFVKDVFQRA